MPENGAGSWGIIIFLVAIFAMMYFFLIRPRQRQQKEHEELTKQLRVGDKVITTGGVYGQIESLGEDTVVLKIESGATMRIARGSILGKQEVTESGGGTF